MMKVILMTVFLIFGLTETAYGEEKQCSTDLDCESLCCHSDTGTCASHSPKGNLFCNKAVGEMCMANDFCAKTQILEFRIVKTGQRADGSPACALRTHAVLKTSPCVDYVCVGASQPAPPVFDPDDCSNAEDL